MTRWIVHLMWTMALAMTIPQSAAAQGTPNTGLPKVTLTIGRSTLVAEVAANPEQRATGLMHRFSLATDHGMLFIFESAQPLGFWMKNTHIPLSIAYIDTRGVILNIEDMAPRDERSHMSKGLARYALEMRQGWFAKNGIVPGMRVQGIPGVP